MNTLSVSSSSTSPTSTSTSTSSSTWVQLERLLQAVGEDVLRAYRDKYIPLQIVQTCPTIYTYENALKWVNFDKFVYFVAQYYQERSPPSSPRPSVGRAPLSPSVSSSSSPPACMTHQAGFSTPSATNTYPYPYPTTPLYADTPTACTVPVLVPQKRPNPSVVNANTSASISENLDPHEDQNQSPPAKRHSFNNRNTKQALNSAAGLVQLTRQSWVDRLEYLKEIPLHWHVPASGESVAYLLDMSDDPTVYVNAKNKRMSMSALIKQKCTDAWSGGTGGSLSKAATVPLFGPGVKCQKMAHDCRGVFLCSRVDPELWKDYNREDRDEHSEYPLFANDTLDAEESGDNAEGESSFDRGRFERAVRFYNMVVKEKCSGGNGSCTGKLEYKPYNALVSRYQHRPYIGCSAASIPTSDQFHDGHFIHEIPIDVDHELLIKLFAMGRLNLSDTLVFNRPCTFTVPPRTGNKQKYCPHIHVENGDIFEATMWQRPCPAKISILTPVDHDIRKALIVPAANIPHNHPFCPWDKRTRKARAAAGRAMHNNDSGDGNGHDHGDNTCSGVDDAIGDLDNDGT